MKFKAEKLFEIAIEEYRNAGFDTFEDYTLREGIGNWACESADDEYGSEEDVREEIMGYIEEDKSMKHLI